MHNIEPFYLWRDLYSSDQDPNALNYNQEYSEFHYTNKVYNYLLHPQWDDFGSETLFYKLLFADYEEGFCIIELIGEWNDAINNDIMQLKVELIDHLISCGIQNFAIILENVLNFHGDTDDYYHKDKIRDQLFFCILNKIDCCSCNIIRFTNNNKKFILTNSNVIGHQLVFSQ